MAEQDRQDGVHAERFDPVARTRDAQRADERLVEAKHRARHGGRLRIALAEGCGVHAPADLVIFSAGETAESKDDVASGTHSEREAVTDVDRVAHRSRRFDAVQAQPLGLIAHIEGSAFVQLVDDLAQDLRNDLGGAEMLLVHGPQRQHLRAEPVGTVLAAVQIAPFFERFRQADRRAFIQTGALGQLSQAQLLILVGKGVENRQGTIDRRHARCACHACCSL